MNIQIKEGYMQKEIIFHNNKKVTKTTKNNGTISYTQRGVYLGIDIKTGKKVTSLIIAKTLRSLDRKITQAKLDFEARGSTLKETVAINTFEELAEHGFLVLSRGCHHKIRLIVLEITLTPTLFLNLVTINQKK
ncbi:hypothetical protein SmuNN2025_0086 [Streptococcus mutans NN2025]|nr:hypothetical protein SmuNN2025_0086 [Streptococcus mutans NN2025]